VVGTLVFSRALMVDVMDVYGRRITQLAPRMLGYVPVAYTAPRIAVACAA